MISRAERLPIKGETRKPAFVSRVSYFTIKAFRSNAPKARFAVVIGKAVYKGAVKRNRLRRLLMRELREYFSSRASQDILLLTLPQAGKVSDEILLEELRRALRAIP